MMNPTDNPSRPNETKHRVLGETTPAIKPAASGGPAGRATRSRHGAITDTLSKWHDYKSWERIVRSQWDTEK
jgi:hypothetical protein